MYSQAIKRRRVERSYECSYEQRIERLCVALDRACTVFNDTTQVLRQLKELCARQQDLLEHLWQQRHRRQDVVDIASASSSELEPLLGNLDLGHEEPMIVD